ncbi:MAG: helix-turn-helix domain-containing protein [Trebonia sp.]
MPRDPGRGGGPGQFAAEQPRAAAQYGPGRAAAGQGPVPGHDGPHGQGQPWPPQGQPGYGHRPGQHGPGQAPRPADQEPFGQRPFGPGQPAGGQYEQGAYQADPNGAGQYGARPMAGQFGPSPWNTGAWQAAGAWQGPGWAPGQQTQGPGGPNVRTTGAWQAADQAQGQDWSVQQGPSGPGGHAQGNWQAAGPGFGAAPPGPGAWQATGPEQGQGWVPGPGGGARGSRDTGSWQAAGPQQGPGWAAGQAQPGPGQPGNPSFGQGARHPGSWQASGAGPGQGWAGPGQQPYQGQPYPGQPYPDPGGPGMHNTGGFSRVGSPVIRQRDSALPDQPPGGKGPIAAIETDNVAAFARDLRVLRSKAGLDYPEMAEKSHYTMRTLASAAGGLRLPTLPVLIAYVNACGGDVGEWEERWHRLSKPGKRAAAALPGGDAHPGAQGRTAQGARQTGEIYVITSARERDAHW